MGKRNKYVLISMDPNDMDALADDVVEDETYVEEIGGPLWTALESIRYLPDPWVVIKEPQNARSKAYLFGHKSTAEEFASRLRARSADNSMIIVVRTIVKRP